MKALALVLALAVPSVAFSQAVDAPLQTSLTPTTARVDLNQPPPPPLHKTWYFWTAIGVGVVAVVAASAAVAISLSQPRPVSETQACGPNGCDACIGLRCS